MAISCIACDSADCALLGALPVFTEDFLGQPKSTPAEAGSMYRCRNCHLHFRFPAATAEVLAAYYRGLSSEDWWQHGSDREVWQEIKQDLRQLPEQTVLDVGCFRGDFLNFLGPEWQRFGIEPSSDARRAAESRGISIIGSTIESLPEDDQQFGAITLIDVIEHLPQPMRALDKLQARLQPGGKLIIFTGNTGAWSWRLAGVNYWYSGMPEHVAFFCPEWFAWAAPKLRCRVSSSRLLRYEPAGLRTRIDEALKNIAFVTYRRFVQFPGLEKVMTRLPVIKQIGRWESCWWTSARDHMLVVLTKEM
ncbi:MAG TPA: class I SAM-dependent methyltransferase [Pyrinomonadaceae bacterium]|nr:class I SAM-dependent methyltransferase [Pyrinomonadaceae bacterium]